MKLCLLLAFSVLLLHKGKGAPRTAVYNFVKCNPEGDQANCVTHQTPEMEWSPDIPSKLPSSSAQFLEAEPVEGESPPREEDEEEEEEEEETPMVDDKGESPVNDDGSGFEGSGFDDKFMADRAFERETGSGESWTEELSKGEGKGRFDEGKPEEQELREDHLLQL